MQLRLASILTHVLTTATIAACGGSLSDDLTAPVESGAGSPDASPSSTGSTKPPPPPPKDGGVVTDAGKDAAVDAGCTKAPVLVGSGQGEGCQDVWHHPCGIPDGVDLSDGLTAEECKLVCGTTSSASGGLYWGCGEYKLDDLPGPAFACYTCVAGRRPEGYDATPATATVGEWLAHAADLERVSIDAFQRMARELAHHGAPAELLDAVAQAERDEVCHTEIVGTLARREGAALSTEPVTQGPVRTLVTIAIENAVEGCIRETYGALVAAWQARRAGRRDVRRAMGPISIDETAHAELAWRVHAWITARLSQAERDQVNAAMAEAVRALAEVACAPVPPVLVAELGLPAAKDARRLVEGLDAHLWAQAA